MEGLVPPLQVVLFRRTAHTLHKSNMAEII